MTGADFFEQHFVSRRRHRAHRLNARGCAGELLAALLPACDGRCSGAAFHEAQDRGDFCGRYCRLLPTGCRGRRGDAASAGVLSSGDRRFHRQGRRPHFQYRRRRRARRIPERGRSRALRDRHPGEPAYPQHGLSAQPADVLSHRHHDRRRGRARRRPAGRRRQHRSQTGGPRRSRRHLHLARGA